MANRPSPCPPLGDIFNQGYISVTDGALLAGQIAAGGSVQQMALERIRQTLGREPTATDLAKLDVNGDGKIGSDDAKILGEYTAGLIDTFPACGLPGKPPTKGELLGDKTNLLPIIAIVAVVGLALVVSLNS